MPFRYRSCVIGLRASIVAAALGVTPSIACAEYIKLSTGEVLNVEILASSSEQITFHHALFGTVTLPRAAVEILPAPAGAAAVAKAAADPGSIAPAGTATSPPAPQAASTDAPAPPAAEPAPPKKDWKFKLTFAAAGASGNTENASIVAKFTALRETEQYKTAIDAGYYFASQDGDKSDNKFTTGFRHDWLMPKERHFFFVDGRYDYDEFQSWLHRVNGHVGVGYRLILPPPFELNALAGIGLVKEWKSDNEDVRPEALLGVEGKWEIAVDHSIVFKSTWYPDLSELGEFRWVNSAAWSWKIAKDSALALTAGVDHEYQSQVNPGREKNDVRVFAGVDWEF